MSLQIIDIIFIIIILLVGFGGFKKGFFSQIITIVGIILGLFLAYFLSDDLSPYLGNIIGEHSFNNMVSFILILLVSLLVTMLVNKIFKTTMENMGSEGIDKILGFIFGLVQGLFICIALTAFLTIQPLVNPEIIFSNSIFGNKIISVLPELEKILPEPEVFKNNIESNV